MRGECEQFIFAVPTAPGTGLPQRSGRRGPTAAPSYMN